MILAGPFQLRLFYDSMISFTSLQLPLCLREQTYFRNKNSSIHAYHFLQ